MSDKEIAGVVIGILFLVIFLVIIILQVKEIIDFLVKRWRK